MASANCAHSALAVLRPRPGGALEVRQREPAWRSFIEGLSFVRVNSVILVLLSMDTAMSALGSYRALLPIFADRFGFGVQGLGLLQSAPAIGSLVGAATLMSFGNIRFKGLVAAGAILCYCGALLLLATAPWFALSMLAAALLGFFDATQTISRTTVIQSLTPDDLRGRVAAFQHMLTGGGPAAGEAMSGAIASVIGPSLALAVGAFSCVAVVFGIVSSRRDLRNPNLGERTAGLAEEVGVPNVVPASLAPRGSP
jgi:predicted MFS family arabinose efflux permease